MADRHRWRIAQSPKEVDIIEIAWDIVELPTHRMERL